MVGFASLITLVSLAVTGTYADTVSRRTNRIPWLDYDGIVRAGQDALNYTVYRRELAELSGASGPLAIRDELEHRSNGTPRCKKIRKRKEWRQLAYNEKKGYIKAIKCLQTKGDYDISPVTDNLYDAFTQVHQTNWTDFHGNAWFLPWHRWFVWVHAEALEHECGYDGPDPYWDYTLDYRNPSGSPIFSTDPVVGFGTHGNIPLTEIGLGGYKVDNGAFANLRVSLPIPHYLTRNFSAWKTADPEGKYGYQLGESYSPAAIAQTLAAPTFWEFEGAIDGFNVSKPVDPNAPFQLSDIPIAGVHNAPHAFNMGDWTGPTWLLGTQWFPAGVVAPNDPMFWPHHTNVDRVWWKWQQQPGKQWEFNGKKGLDRVNDAFPSDILPFYNLGPDPVVALTLKTENWPMCYTY